MVLKLLLLNSFFPDESLRIFMHFFKGNKLYHVVIRLIFNIETKYSRIKINKKLVKPPLEFHFNTVNHTFIV